MDQQNRFTLKEVLETRQGERHLIVLHSEPDPDAISSAYTHQMIAAEYGIDTTITYQGKISLRNDIALVKLLDIDLVLYTAQMDLSQFQGAIFINNQGATVEDIVHDLEINNIPIVLIIDHHEPQGKLQADCIDIRRVGATATIYADYLQQNIIDLDNGKRAITMAATALMYGIQSDTNEFIRATSDDFIAAAFLSRFRDIDLLSQINNRSRSKPVMELIRRALENRLIVESFSIAGIGYLRAEDQGAIPLAADFLVSEENVHSALVYGIVQESDAEEWIIGSMRTAKITIKPDEFLKELFGSSVEGRFHEGGKTSAGRFTIPLGFLSGNNGDNYKAMKWKIYDEKVKHKILAKIGVETKILEKG